MDWGLTGLKNFSFVHHSPLRIIRVPSVQSIIFFMGQIFLTVLLPTLVFIQCWAFEAAFSPTWLNEIKKQKLKCNTEPQHWINILLAAGHFVHRDTNGWSLFVFYFSKLSAYNNLCRGTQNSPRNVLLNFVVRYLGTISESSCSKLSAYTLLSSI